MKKVGFLLLVVALVATLAVSVGYAKGEGTLVIYNCASSEMINWVVDHFQQATGIKCLVVTAATGETLTRIKAESANPQADIMFTGGVDSAGGFRQYFQDYVSSQEPYLEDKTVGHPWYNALYFHPMVIIYNTDLVKPGEVTGWRDLLNPKWRGKVLMPDPRHSGSAFGEFMIMLSAFGKYDLGWDYVKRLVRNLVIVPHSSQTYKETVAGEYPLGLCHEWDVYQYKNSGAHVDVVYPVEGTAFRPDAVYIVKGAKHLEAAKKFVDFVLSKEAMNYFVSQGLRPNRVDVAPPAGLPPASKIPVVKGYDPVWAAQNRTSLLQRWTYIINNSDKIYDVAYKFEDEFPLHPVESK